MYDVCSSSEASYSHNSESPHPTGQLICTECTSTRSGSLNIFGCKHTRHCNNWRAVQGEMDLPDLQREVIYMKSGQSKPLYVGNVLPFITQPARWVNTSRKHPFYQTPRIHLKSRHPPAHSWYRSEGPGTTIRFKGDRKGQTALARLDSIHLKTLRFSRGDKKFNICIKCNMIEATLQHLLDCVALVYDDLLKRPDFVLEVIKANDLMDLISFRSKGLERRRQGDRKLFYGFFFKLYSRQRSVDILYESPCTVVTI
ncbi:hypothetical protein AVEN_104145-1 [Araneus ventricosus]|uniref:Uncharacterized protein n=1 Tax=Araneus ventricosus TaxID=182803 RepID=A0A4Y2SER7_ARAVE|nr:hypothetical protein AVEN_104145-1 [Araneus ventricosus]